MAVSWVTKDDSEGSIVFYGSSPTELTNKVEGSSDFYNYLGYRYLIMDGCACVIRLRTFSAAH